MRACFQTRFAGHCEETHGEYLFCSACDALALYLFMTFSQLFRRLCLDWRGCFACVCVCFFFSCFNGSASWPSLLGILYKHWPLNNLLSQKSGISTCSTPMFPVFCNLVASHATDGNHKNDEENSKSYRERINGDLKRVI